jgi:hypothetical protein
MAICNFMLVIKAYLTNNLDLKVLMVLDNAPSYDPEQIQLSHLKVVMFMTPNKSLLQCMDQKVFKIFKSQ